MKHVPKPSTDYSWQCNECGSDEFTSGVSEDDLQYLSCTNCGGNEFHKNTFHTNASKPSS